MMNTIIVVAGMAIMATVLLIGAIVADRMLTARMDKRRSSEEAGVSEKHTTADTVIEILDRTSDMMRKSLEAAGEDQPKQGSGSS
jgi:hypothetical protein